MNTGTSEPKALQHDVMDATKSPAAKRAGDNSPGWQQEPWRLELIRQVLAKPRKDQQPPPGVKNWIGKRTGKIVVIAYGQRRFRGGATQNGHIHYWIVRCDCGTYELRRQKSLGEKKKTYDNCDACKRKEYEAWLATQPPRQNTEGAVPTTA